MKTGREFGRGPRPVWRPIGLAMLAFYGVFIAGGSLFAFGNPHPLRVELYNLLTGALSVAFSALTSLELDRRRARSGRDSWAAAVVVSIVAAAVAEPAVWLVTRLPAFPGQAHRPLFEISNFGSDFLLFLLWALLHVFVRSGQRALAQERRLAAVREAMLGDETEALLYSLNPAFLLDALSRIALSVRTGAQAAAGDTVIALAEHMRAALSKGLARSQDDQADSALESPDACGAFGAEPDLRRRFLIWTNVVWLALLGVIVAAAAVQSGRFVAFLVQYAPQPVVAALWCIVMERALARRSGRPMRSLYLEACGLCLAGVCVTTAALVACTAALGLLDRFHVAWLIPATEFYDMAPAFLAWTAAWFVMEAHRREAARLRSVAEIREAARKARNAMLRQQVNPHFLFNALNALYALILDGDVERAQGAIGAIRRFVELAEGPARDDLVALSCEFETQEAYLDIERVRFGDRLQIERRIAADLEGAKVPHLILQPLVENAIKYGVSRTHDPVRVELAAERAGGELVLTVKDTGASDAAPRPPGLGVGLKNVEGRLRSLYGEAGRLACAPLSPAGFVAELRLPLVL